MQNTSTGAPAGAPVNSVPLQVVSDRQVVVGPGLRHGLERADLVQVGRELHRSLRLQVPFHHSRFLEPGEQILGAGLVAGHFLVDLDCGLGVLANEIPRFLGRATHRFDDLWIGIANFVVVKNCA